MAELLTGLFAGYVILGVMWFTVCVLISAITKYDPPIGRQTRGNNKMKIREGFVSNSSSTSFCICGICAEESYIKKMFGIEDISELEDEFEIYNQDEYYPTYVGVDISYMKDDETKAEFRKRVHEALSKRAGKDVGEIGLVTDGWYDG